MRTDLAEVSHVLSWNTPVTPVIGIHNFLYLLCSVCVSVVVNSPVQTRYDNGAVPAICSPLSDCLHQILYCSPNLTTLLGTLIDKT